MVIFSGVGEDGEPVIFDYIMGVVDPSVSFDVEWEFTYTAQGGPSVESVQVEFPEVDGAGVNEILVAAGTEVD